MHFCPQDEANQVLGNLFAPSIKDSLFLEENTNTKKI